MLVDILLDKIEQHDGHLKTLRCGRGFEAVVKFCSDIDIHSLNYRSFLFSDLTHPLSEVSI